MKNKNLYFSVYRLVALNPAMKGAESFIKLGSFNYEHDALAFVDKQPGDYVLTILPVWE